MPETRPFTSIITVTYNSNKCLQRLRNTLFKATSQPFEWIIVDNASTKPETLTELADIEACRQARVFYESQNLWFTKGCNRGIKEASGELIVLLNPDCAPLTGWLEVMWQTAKPRLRNVGIVGAVLVNESSKIVHGGAVGYGDHYGAGDLYAYGHPAVQERRCQKGEWVTGACLMVTKKALQSVGGKLDELFPHYHSDRVLCDAVRAAGFSIWMSRAVVIHTVGGCEL